VGKYDTAIQVIDDTMRAPRMLYN